MRHAIHPIWLGITLAFFLSLLPSAPAAAQSLLPQQCNGATVVHFADGLTNVIKTQQASVDSNMAACGAFASYQPAKLLWTVSLTASCLDTNITQSSVAPSLIYWSDNTTSTIQLANSLPLAALIGEGILTFNITSGHFSGHQVELDLTLVPYISQTLCALGTVPIYYVNGVNTFLLE
jgi:hypothetical protein